MRPVCWRRMARRSRAAPDQGGRGRDRHLRRGLERSRRQRSGRGARVHRGGGLERSRGGGGGRGARVPRGGGAGRPQRRRGHQADEPLQLAGRDRAALPIGEAGWGLRGRAAADLTVATGAADRTAGFGYPVIVHFGPWQSVRRGSGSGFVGVCEKSKALARLGAFASLDVSGSRPQLSSMNFSMESNSLVRWSTYPCFAYGDSTIRGTRNP